MIAVGFVGCQSPQTAYNGTCITGPQTVNVQIGLLSDRYRILRPATLFFSAAQSQMVPYHPWVCITTPRHTDTACLELRPYRATTIPRRPSIMGKYNGYCWELPKADAVSWDSDEHFCLRVFSCEMVFVNQDCLQSPEVSRCILGFLPPISSLFSSHRSFRSWKRLTWAAHWYVRNYHTMYLRWEGKWLEVDLFGVW